MVAQFLGVGRPTPRNHVGYIYICGHYRCDVVPQSVVPVHKVCTYSDGLWASHNTGQCIGGGHYGNRVGGPHTQSTDGGSGVTGPSTH